MYKNHKADKAAGLNTPKKIAPAVKSWSIFKNFTANFTRLASKLLAPSYLPFTLLNCVNFALLCVLLARLFGGQA